MTTSKFNLMRFIVCFLIASVLMMVFKYFHINDFINGWISAMIWNFSWDIITNLKNTVNHDTP